MPSPTRRQGDRAERAVIEHLRRLSWTIVDHNVAFRVGELDIVAIDPTSAHLVFVEVRSGRGDITRPEDTVTRPKQRRLTKAAQLFLARAPHARRPARFDVVSVCSRSLAIRAHYRGAFDACAS